MTLKAEPKRKRRSLLMEPAPAQSLEPGAAANESVSENRERKFGADSRVTCHYQPASTAGNFLAPRATQDNNNCTFDASRHHSSLAFGQQINDESSSPSLGIKSRIQPTGHHQHQFVIQQQHQRDSSTNKQHDHDRYSNMTSHFKMPLGQQQQQQQSRNSKTARRKSELTSFLTILFGSLLFALVAMSLSGCNSQDHNGTSHQLAAGSLNTRPTTLARTLTGSTGPVVSSTMTPETSKASLAETTAAVESSGETLAETSGPETASDSGELADEQPTTAADEGENSGAERTKLRELIVDSANSGVDVLLNHLSPPTSTETPLESGADGEVDGSESTDIDYPPTNSSSNSNNNNNNSTKQQHQPETSNGAPQQAGKLLASSLHDEMSFPPDHPANKFAMDTWQRWRGTADDIIELFSLKVLPVIMRHGYDVDSATVSGLLQAFNGIRSLKPWALKLLDASTKLAPGILVGTQSDFGDFDECLNIRVDDPSGFAASNADFPVSVDEETGLKSTTLVGRYCLADVEFPKPARSVRSGADRARQAGVSSNQSDAIFETYLPIELRRPLLNFSETTAFKDTIFVETGNFFHMLYVDPMRVGICLTNKIDPDSFAFVLNKLLEEFAISINFRGRCVTKYERPKWTVFQVYSAYVLLVACSLVALSTLLDVLQLKLNKLPWPARHEQARVRLNLLALRYRPLYTSFSLLRNTKRLFKPQRSALVERALAELQHQQQQQQLVAGQQFKLNLTGASQFQVVQAAKSSVGSAPSVATTTSSIPDSSVESSPTIERRSSSTTSSSTSKCGSTLELLMDGSSNYYNAAPNGQTASSSGAGNKVRDSNQISLLSLHGVRVITMTWMIVNHTYMFGGFFVLWAHRRLIDIAEWPKSLSFQMVLNGWLTVETYFFLSALIIVLNVMPLMRSNKFNYFGYILHRLMRLLPAYVGLVCLNFLWPLVSSGPVWLVKGKSFVQTPCENYLWTNFLFINNWIWPEKQCMVHTWFLSADFQLYILAPVIVYLLYRRPALGHTLNILVAILASVLSGFVIYANKLLPTTLINKLEFDAIKQQLSYSYFATYQHMGPYCLGILTGYILHKRPHIHLPKYLTWLLWILLPPLSFTTLLLTYLWNGAYDDPALINPSPLVSAFYVAIHRTIWTALVAWLVFACTTGRAKLLNQFLSHSAFIPISRLSYSIYLVHLPVIMFRSLNLRHTVDWSDQNILYEACGNFVASIFMAYFLNVTFESPIINLENYFSGRDRAKRVAKKSSPSLTFEGHKQHQRQQQVEVGHQSSTCDSSSAADTSSRHSEDPSNLIETNQHGQDDVRKVNQQLSSGASQRKSFRPKQDSSVERIFGEIQEASANHPPASDYSIASSNTSSRSEEFEVERPAEPTAPNMIANHHLSLMSTSENPEPSNRLDRRRSARKQQLKMLARERLNDTSEVYRGDANRFYNATSSEYHHYAPGGYRQWRMYMNGTGPQVSRAISYARPFQYATLARTSRLGQQDGLMLARLNRLEPLDEPSTGRLNEDRFLHAESRMMSANEEPNLRLRSELRFGTDGNARDARIQQASSGRHRQVHTHPLGRPNSGRYNTLTGTRMRDLRSQYDLDEQSHRNRAYKWPESVLLRPPSESLAPEDQQPFWLAQGPMIPRIDSSTLRRQQVRPTASSIVEEPVHDYSENQEVEEKSTL